MIHKKTSMRNFLVIVENSFIFLISGSMRVYDVFILMCLVVRDRFIFKMFFPWKMKILMI